MINLNKVVLVGRLTKDLELRKTNNNKSWCSFTVAVDRQFQSQQPGAQTADFINCVAFGQPADYLTSYANKGTIVSVDGRIQTRSYPDQSTGKTVYVTEVVADRVQTISNRNNNNQSATNYQNNYTAPASNQTFTPKVEPDYDDSYDDIGSTPALDITNDDLPFY